MKNIVISGASKGIGRATAEKFVATGARVFNLSRGPSGVSGVIDIAIDLSLNTCLLYTSPSPRDKRQSRMPSSA